MARTIGLKWKNDVIMRTKVQMQNKELSAHDITQKVIEELPQEPFDVWEGARAEIEQVIWDTVFGKSDGTILGESNNDLSKLIGKRTRLKATGEIFTVYEIEPEKGMISIRTEDLVLTVFPEDVEILNHMQVRTMAGYETRISQSSSEEKEKRILDALNEMWLKVGIDLKTFRGEVNRFNYQITEKDYDDILAKYRIDLADKSWILLFEKRGMNITKGGSSGRRLKPDKVFRRTGVMALGETRTSQSNSYEKEKKILDAFNELWLKVGIDLKNVKGTIIPRKYQINKKDYDEIIKKYEIDQSEWSWLGLMMDRGMHITQTGPSGRRQNGTKTSVR